MAENKKSVLLYCDIIHTVEKLDDKTAGQLFKHYLRYINDQNPKPKNSTIDLVFEPIKQNLKRDLKKYRAKCEQNSENVKKRWDKKNTTEYKRIQTDTKHTDKDNGTDTENDNDKVIIKPKKKSVKKIIYPEDFEKVWSIYPRIGDKQDGYKKYKLIEDKDLFLKAVINYAKDQEGKDPQYTIGYRNFFKGDWLNWKERKPIVKSKSQFDRG